jgi:hypothetical protein
VSAAGADRGEINGHTEEQVPGWAFIGLFALALILYFAFVFPWMLEWGATPEETFGPLPGDDVVPSPMYRSTRALTIGAPVEDVWPWVAQIGQDRGGFYSATWVENMLLADIHNARTINPDWQSRQEGDLLPLTPPRYPLGLRERKASALIRRCAEEFIVLDGWGVSSSASPGKLGHIRDPAPPMSCR